MSGLPVIGRFDVVDDDARNRPGTFAKRSVSQIEE
jgi:hypothetical protein